MEKKMKPYTCELSKTKPMVNICCEGDIVFSISIIKTESGMLHDIIRNALNGAFTLGYLNGKEDQIEIHEKNRHNRNT